MKKGRMIIKGITAAAPGWVVLQARLYQVEGQSRVGVVEHPIAAWVLFEHRCTDGTREAITLPVFHEEGELDALVCMRDNKYLRVMAPGSDPRARYRLAEDYIDHLQREFNDGGRWNALRMDDELLHLLGEENRNANPMTDSFDTGGGV